MLSEAETRLKIIDSLLEKAGWNLKKDSKQIDPKESQAITEYPTISGPLDYLLTSKGMPIAAVEAKKEGKSIDGVLTQALRYAEDLVGVEPKYNQYKVPFIYSTNGTKTRFQDLTKPHSSSREVMGFHTPDALLEMLSNNRTDAIEYLKTHPVKEEYGGRELRYYQKDAVNFAVNGILNGRRKMLIAMATGTGKTFMASALIYHLLKAGYFKRILFLVDRRSLASQTTTALSVFEPEKGNKFDTIYSVYCDKIPTDEESENVKYNAQILQPSQLKNRQNANTFVYVSTIQRLYSMLKGKDYVETGSDDEWADGDDTPIPYNENFPIDSFDLIISDECHRSIYNKWKYVLDYFDAYQIGLTATPAIHTAAYFDCTLQSEIFTYSYEQAINDGYLVDFDAVRVKTDIDMEEEVRLTKGEAMVVMDKGTGYKTDTLLEDDLNVDISSLERKITIEDRNRKIVHEVLSYIEKDQKTIVFAVNDFHADQLVDLFRKAINEGDDVVQKITYSTDHSNEQIKRFRNLDLPRIVVSVDMLSTGVDIPKVENLVIIRPIKSRILYEQIIGRGTRLCPEINKTHFTVFDAVGVIEFMRENGGEVIQPTSEGETSIKEAVNGIKQDREIDKNIQIISRKLKRISRDITPEGKEQLANFGISNGDLDKFNITVQDRLFHKDEELLELFGSDDFQKFVKNYPRIRKGFLISKEKQADIVVSEYMFRTTDGRELRPTDYLESFKHFIQVHSEDIEALRTLLESPRKFTMKEFNEIREQLATTPERFTESRLQQANEIVTHLKTPADLYSFVSSAVWGTELITPTERVNNAFDKLSMYNVTEEQKEWLSDIKSHLVSNIVIEPTDFNALPFSRRGGFNKANRDFNGSLPELLDKVNEYVLRP